MSQSQNGWQVLDDDTSGPYPRLREWALPNVRRTLLARDGSAGFLLVHLALWFNDEVELIDIGFDDWGWSPRRISGSTEWSNHASGTAIDLNADRHPAGVPTTQTFSTAETFAIHTRLKLYSGCLKWGGDFRSRPDAMHYEISADLDPVVSKAQSLADTPRGKRILRKNKGARKLIFS